MARGISSVNDAEIVSEKSADPTMPEDGLDLTKLSIDDLRQLQADTVSYIERLESKASEGSELEEPGDIPESKALADRVTQELRARGLS